MDWDKLRIFHAVAEAGSFTHAAATLNLSQSAISRQVSALEAELGVALFHRHARGLVMTEQGETLYRTAHDVQLKLDAVKFKLADSTERPEGRLRLTTTVGLGTGWLTPRIHEFLELYPDVQLELILENGELDLVTREADCAVWFRKPAQGDLIQRRLFTVHFHIYASPIYIEKHGQPQGIDELDRHRVVTFGENLPVYLSGLNWLETAGRPPGHPRVPVFSVNNLSALRKVVESGAGIAVLPDYIVDRGHSLVQLIQHAEVPQFDTYFVYADSMRTSARLQAFRDFLISKARQWQF
jgi:DNA-binding transcriptional LysR family regulator